MICESCFAHCKSLISIFFESKSKLSRLEKLLFYRSGLTSIHLPASVVGIGESCFFDCGVLTSISFERESKLSRIEENAFCRSGLTSIHLPASVEVIAESCFDDCKSLRSVTAEVGSKLRASRFSREFRKRFPMAFLSGVRSGGAVVAGV
jgi:hypothetical protein